MGIINIKKLSESLQQIEWNYDFKISLNKKNNSATISIPGFILKDINWAIEEGIPTQEEQVSCCSDSGENENAYWEWDIQGNRIAVIYGEYSLDGKPIEIISRDTDGVITEFRYIEE